MEFDMYFEKTYKEYVGTCNGKEIVRSKFSDVVIAGLKQHLHNEYLAAKESIDKIEG